MDHVTSLLRTYYQANLTAWEALRRASARVPEIPLVVAIGGYVALSTSLHASGHPTAGWIVTVTVGLLLVVIGWTV